MAGRSWSWLIAGGVALAGCGGGDDPPGDPIEARSGARIKLRRYVYEDGASTRERDLFYDAERAEDCRPTRWSDGITRCTPANWDLAYADADCTAEIGRDPDSRGAARYFRRNFRISGQTTISKLFVAGAQLPRPAQIWVVIDGVCTGPLDPGEREYFALGAEVPATDFMRIKRSLPIGDGRLATIFLTSDDGLSAAIAVHDRELDATCTPAAQPRTTVIEGEPPPPPGICRPEDVLEAAYYADPECTERELAVSRSGDVPRTASFVDYAGCEAFRQVGAETLSTTLYAMAGNQCIPVSPPGGQRRFLLGETVPVAGLERAPDQSTRRRLHRILYRDPGGEPRATDERMYDSTLDAECATTRIDDVFRCLPTDLVPTRTYFRNDVCSDPIELAAVPNGECVPAASFAQRTESGAVTLHALGTPYAEPLYELSTGDRCVATVFNPRILPHTIGPAIGFEQFALATPLADP